MANLETLNVEILKEVFPHTGEMRCKGWRQEAILRLLENNMANAEKPEELIIYGGIGKCARNWESYHAIVKSLLELENNETLVVQSGMPVAVFRTHESAPCVLMANTNIMKATWPIFYDLQEKNLTMFAQYTAGPWEYIGTQGVIQGTFQTLAAIGLLHFDNSLVGRILLTAGMGGMGGNQPRAMTMLGGVSICVDADREVIQRRLDVGYCDVCADSFEEAVDMARKAAAEKKALGITVEMNAVAALRRAREMGFNPDIITDMTPAHDPISYIPDGLSPGEANQQRRADRTKYLGLARKSLVEHLGLMNDFLDAGVQVFEYGNSLRKEARDGGMPESQAMKIPGFVAAYIRPLFCEGRGPFRWMCLSGESEDLRKIDDMVLEIFKDDDLVSRWITLAKEVIPIEALPARVCYLGFGQRKEFALRVNEMVADGTLKAPVAFSRDNLDTGSIVNPTFESENMKDGSDLISDWPYLNALLNTAAGADLVAIQGNYSMGEAVHTGVTMVADGTEESARRLEASMTTDPGIGVVRHAQAGYETARECADEKFKDNDVRVPLWWSPNATFGPDDASS